MIKMIRIPLIALLVAVTALTACTKDKGSSTAGGTTPATLQGQSEFWNVRLSYAPKGNVLEETVTIMFQGTDKLEAATVTVIRDKETPKPQEIVEPSLLVQGQAMMLVDKAEVKSWKDTKQVEIEWTAAGNTTKNYISVAAK